MIFFLNVFLKIHVTGLENKLDAANKLIQDQENKLQKLDAFLDAANILLWQQSLEVEECKTRIPQLENEVAGLRSSDSRLGSSRDNSRIIELSDLEEGAESAYGSEYKS